jgi:STE24 endopeptidase
MNEDKAARYQRLKRKTSVLSLSWTALFLAGLLLTGASLALRDSALSLARAVHSPGVLQSVVARSLYLVFLGLINEIVAVPLGFYGGYVLEHRYGLSTETVRHWAREHVKGLLVGGVFGLVGVNLLYAAIARWPEQWWIAAGAGLALFTVLLAHLGPVLLLPLFYKVTPLGRESLRARLVGLAGRAGVRVLNAYEWRMSDRTKKANAALTGLGNTRRILVSDTLLADYSDDEIEMVLAHELGHHVHRDIWKGIALETGLALAGFWLASRLLVTLAPVAGLSGPSDVAGLPLLALCGTGVSLVLLPAANALSRLQERLADRYALDLGQNAEAFISAMRRLGSQNLSEEHPSRLARIMFYSHPPVNERIDMARARLTNGPAPAD